MRKQVMKKYVLAALAVMSAGYATANGGAVQLGLSTGTNAIAIGVNSMATSVEGLAKGAGAVATGGGYDKATYELKVVENSELTNKIQEINNDINGLVVEKEINNQNLTLINLKLDHAREQQANVADKLNRIADLNSQLNVARENAVTLQNTMNAADANYQRVRHNNNLDTVFSQLDWNNLNLPNGRQVVADELKAKITQLVPAMNNKFDDAVYLNLVDGYKGASFVAKQLEVISNNEEASRLFDEYKNRFNEYGYYVYKSDYVNLLFKAKEQGKNLNNIEFLDNPADVLLDEHNLLKDEFSKTSDNNWPSGAAKEVNEDLYRATSGEDDKKLNSLMAYQVMNKTDRLYKYSNYRDYFNISRYEGIGYSHIIEQLLRGYETTDAYGYYQENTVLNEVYNQIDWNAQDTVVDLQALKPKMDKLLELDQAKKRWKQVDNAIKESTSQNDDLFIERNNLEKRIDALKAEINTWEKDKRGVFVTPVHKDRLNQRMKETEHILLAYANAINNSNLVPYSPDNAVAVAFNNEVSKIQQEYINAQNAFNSNQANIDSLNQELGSLELTPDETVVDQKRAELETQLTAAQERQATIVNEITSKNNELTRLKETLANSSLKNIGLHTQAQGMNAFASGDDAISIGTNSTSTSREAITIGKDSTVSGEQSIALGSGNTVTGDSSIAIGVGHHVSGDRSTTIGDPNVITGNDVFVAGNNNTVASNKVLVLGNNVNVAEGFDGAVVLGDSSAPAKATPVANMVIKNKEYAVAGTTPTATVSVGAKGTERQITNVAAGEVSETSTDAVNGSQLHAVIQSINTIEATSNNMGEITQRIDAKAEQLMQHIGKVEDTLEAAIAGNNAAIALPQVTKPGDVMVSVATGGYAGKGAVAVGVSASSADGKTTFKSQINANSENKFGYGLGLGFVW